MLGACGQEPVSKITGGFVGVPVASLLAVWRACRARPLGIGDFRAWLASRELVARRCVLEQGMVPSYDIAELARLLGVTPRRARASVKRLVGAGLLEWSDSAINFPELLCGNVELLADTIGGGRGSVAIPRRMLRLLAGGARPALIATALGVILRCLSRRRGGFRGRGRLKVSWVADVFGVDLRRVKAARLELVALGWIEPEVSGQRAENRWGRAYRIDLEWERSRAGGRGLPPLPTGEGPAIATPSVDREPLPEGEINQQPAGRGPSGARPGGQEGTKTGPEAVHAESVRIGMKPVSGPLPSPKLDDIRPEDLRDVGRLLELHRQAVVRGLASPSEDGRLKFLALAEHARAVGKDPGALLASLLARGAWAFATAAEEDAARRRLRLHEFGPGAGGAMAMMTPKPPAGPTVWDDVRIVREVRAATIRAGIYRDPWPEFHRLNPGWTRARWDAAVPGGIPEP